MKNTLKAKLGRKEVCLGIAMGLGSTLTAETLANMGFDYLWVDMQHTPLSTETVEKIFQAMSYTDTVPMVRIVSNDLGLVNRALDIGASAVIVPLVNSRQDAEKAVKSSRYPPQGMRSIGPRRPSIRDPNYFATANSEVMIIPQIETDQALKNVEDIVTTEGVNAIYVGPVDLSISLGIYRQFDNPKFTKAEETIISACNAHGVAPGLLAPTGPVEKSLGKGYKLLSIAGEVGLLTEAAKKTLTNARSMAEKLVK